jgi:ketohexokinase/beta-glucosidase
MVWAGISLHTKTQMVPIHQNLNAARYQNDILQPVAIPHTTANRGMVLMQYNATPHTARTTQQMLQGHNIRILDWPPCSLDLNPIEHVWYEIDRRVRQLPQPQNLAQLERNFVNTWTNLPQRFLFNYVNSMRTRCLAVIRANGGHTRY